MMIRTVIAVASVICLSAAMPVCAQNPLESVTDAADRAVMADAAAVMAAREPTVAALDAILVRLTRPTPLRGMVQTTRAHAFMRLNRDADALRAIEEAMTLLPGHPAPTMMAIWIMTFSGAPQRAADLWLNMSTTSADIARQVEPYVMDALVGRLNDLGDRIRADRLSARMGEIGFAALLAPQRSSSALAGARTDVAAGRVDAARDTVARIGDPDHLLGLYVDKRYEALWPRIAEWAGADLTGQGRRHLEDLRREWSEAQDFTTATHYARELAGYREHATVVTLFLPMLEREGLSAKTPGIEFLTVVVAGSLAKTGREAEARTLIMRVASIYPDDTTGQSLNLDGSLITRAFEAERWDEASTRASAFLVKAQKLGNAVNSSAVLAVQAMRGCALWQAGRREEAAPDLASVVLARSVQPNAALRMHLCRGDTDAARTLLIDSLATEAQRSWALVQVRPTTLPDYAPRHERAEHAALELLRRDPQVVAAVAPVGRILPQPIGETLPNGFDPFAARQVGVPRDAI